MRITSSSFRHGEHIPHRYSRYGEDKSPPLRIDDVPANAGSLVLIMDDPDATRGTFTHWILFDLDPKTVEIGEDRVPEKTRRGTNDWGETQYGGPRPPSGDHRYFFKFYALDKKLDLPNGATRQQVEQGMNGHVLDQADLMGRFAAPVEAGQASR